MTPEEIKKLIEEYGDVEMSFVSKHKCFWKYTGELNGKTIEVTISSGDCYDTYAYEAKATDKLRYLLGSIGYSAVTENHEVRR